MNRATIGVAIIALNEEQNLPGLLASLAWVDQIIVVDGGSTDATVAIAESHGCHTVVRPFDQFSEQRNRALELVTADWTLFVDVDERPTPELIAEIERAVGDPRFNGWRVPIRSQIFGRPFRYSGTQNDRPIRLVRRGRGRWVGAVHEVLQVDSTVGCLSAALEHSTIPNLGVFRQKVRRYTDLEARARVAAAEAPRAIDRWFRPWLEFGRRLIWKRGFLDGPTGWAFCLLSGWSEWVLANQHQRLWKCRHVNDALAPAR